MSRLNRQQMLDLYFMDARSKLIDIAAFLDRVDRSSGKADFRIDSFRKALKALNGKKPGRARQVLLSLSDPSTKPIAKATVKGAVGAYLNPGRN